ncbi:phage tail tape measure protein [Desulfovibrio oxyclinae]|uniref:phage tail tape measure protein n=1 Tax=Desulfovibrio oxyclinae TaxID=63560 RepID=UPI00039E030B|nr:phage tail tape measure protein [Desulfovibrio oxyclinae]
MPETQIIISAKDMATSQLRKAGLAVDALTRRAMTLQNAFVAAGGAMFLRDVTQRFEQYEVSLRDMSKVTDQSLQEIDSQLGELPHSLGTMTELVQGYYQTISAGVKEPAAAMEMLTASAQSSKGAHVSQSKTIKALTKVMKGLEGEFRDASDAADLLFSIEKEGQTSFAELVPVIGDVAAISGLLGVKAEEMGAALAAISQTAGTTSQAATQYRAILMGLIKPQERMRDLLESMNVASGEALVQQYGLAGALREVKQRADASGMSMGRLFESSEALTGMAPMLADDFETYGQALDQMERRQGRAARAFHDFEETLRASRERFQNTLDATMLDLGEDIAPDLKQTLNGLSDWLDQNGDKLVTTLGGAARHAGDFAEIVGRVFDKTITGWNQLPDVVQEIGLIGAIVGGAKARAAIVLVSAAIGQIKDTFDEGKKVTDRDKINAVMRQEMNFLANRRKRLAELSGQSLETQGPAIRKQIAESEARIKRLTDRLAEMRRKAGEERRQAEHDFRVLDNRSGQADRDTPAPTNDPPPHPSPTPTNVERSGPSASALAAQKAALEQRKQVLTEFNVEYQRMSLGRYDYEMKLIEDEAKRFEQAGADKVKVNRWASEQILQIEDERAAAQKRQHEMQLAESDSMIDGLILGASRYERYSQTAAESIADVYEGAFRRVEQLGTDMVFNMKGDLSDLTNLVKQVAQEIFRINVMKPLTSSLASGVGSFFGDLFSGGDASGGGNQSTKLAGADAAYANGGVSVGPQLAWVSEGRYRKEAHVPLPDGRTIPVTIRGSGGGGGVVFNIDSSVHVAGDVSEKNMALIQAASNRAARDGAELALKRLRTDPGKRRWAMGG